MSFDLKEARERYRADLAQRYESVSSEMRRNSLCACVGLAAAALGLAAYALTDGFNFKSSNGGKENQPASIVEEIPEPTPPGY